MTAQFIDRRQLKIDTRERLRSAQVSPLVMTALYLGILLVLDVADTISSNGAASVPERPLPGIFIYALAALLSVVLGAGFTLYCMAVRRGERAEFQTLFDGFSLAGKVVGLYLLTNLFILLWAMLFILPGIIASYRYRFAMYNLLENPDLGILEALRLSKIQTWGYKGQLFFLDVSYLGWILLSAAPSLLLLVLVWSARLGPGAAERRPDAPHGGPGAVVPGGGRFLPLQLPVRGPGILRGRQGDLRRLPGPAGGRGRRRLSLVSPPAPRARPRRVPARRGRLRFTASYLIL